MTQNFEQSLENKRIDPISPNPYSKLHYKNSHSYVSAYYLIDHIWVCPVDFKVDRLLKEQEIGEAKTQVEEDIYQYEDTVSFPVPIENSSSSGNGD